MAKERIMLCTFCKERVAEYDLGRGVYLCKGCYEALHFNIFQQMEEFDVF